MAISMFETRTLVDLVQQMKTPRTFLKNTFFSNTRTFDTLNVDIDIYKGKRRIAPFVAPKVGGKTVERLGYQTTSYRPALVAPDMITTAEDLLKRAPGENIYGAMSPDERAAIQLGRDIVDLDDMITRREEWMCANALFNGQIPIVGEGVNDVITFGTMNGETLAGASKWSAADSKPLDDLRRFARKVSQNSGLMANMAILSNDVVDVFLNNAQVKEYFIKAYRPEFGIIAPENMPDGVTFIGRVVSAGLNVDVYSYDEWYIDENGVEQSMVPAGKVLMASTRARTELCYGAVTIAQEGNSMTTIAMPRVPNSWVETKPAARFIALSSRPLPVPSQIDAFYVATVI